MADCKKQTTEPMEEQKEESAAFDASKCEEMLAQGKRNLLCGEVPQSVNQLQEVCRLLAAQYGETAAECAEAYVQYGSALLELSRMESRVLGNALQGMTEDEVTDEQQKDVPDDSFTVPSNITDAEKEKISEEIIDAMLEQPDDTAAAGDDSAEKSTDKTTTENVDEKCTETPSVADTTDTSTERTSTEAEVVAEVDAAAETQDSDAAKQPSTTTDEAVVTATSVDEKGDADRDDVERTDVSDKPDAATETGAGDAKSETATPGQAQRVPVTMTTEDDSATKDADVEESEMTDSDVENKLNPDEYEDDTTEFEQSETAANDSQTEEEDVSNLQLAWEMLELAKNIYQKQDGVEAKKRQAECLKKLGEVGLESEQYSQSVEDFTGSLDILRTCVADVKTDRSIAETQYHIGVACVYAGRYDDAVTHFRDAISVLEAKNSALQQVVAAAEGKDASEEADEVTAAHSEMKDIAELIPEIKLKIEDAEEEKSSVHLKDVMKAGDGETSLGFGSEETATFSASVIGVKPVDDVSHLVRKKRKPEDEAPNADDAKKAKTVDTESDTVTDAAATVSAPAVIEMAVDSVTTNAAATAPVVTETAAKSVDTVTDTAATVSAPAVTETAAKSANTESDTVTDSAATVSATAVTETAVDSVTDGATTVSAPAVTETAVASEAVVNGCTDAVNGAGAEARAAVNGCDEEMELTGDSDVKIAGHSEIKVKSVAECTTADEEPVAME